MTGRAKTREPIDETPTVIAESTHSEASGVAHGHDPFDPAKLRISHTSDEALGIKKPLLIVPVNKPSKQIFFRAHPDPNMRLDARIIELKETREIFLVTPEIAAFLPGETKLVRLTPCLSRQGAVFLWPVPIATGEQRESTWHITARSAADLAIEKWVRLQANMALAAYDVMMSEAIPDPVWPQHTLKELLTIAFGNDRLVDRHDHPIIRQLLGQV
jgi:hypothetical protein